MGAKNQYNLRKTNIWKEKPNKTLAKPMSERKKPIKPQLAQKKTKKTQKKLRKTAKTQKTQKNAETS